MQNDVFISYSRKDWKLVERFYDKLIKLGYNVWIDKDGIESGDAFKKTILKAIKSSRCLIFFSSVNSNSSDWTAKEIGIAVKNKIPIIPVLFDDACFNEDVEFDLVNLDFMDFSKEPERDKQFTRFVTSIKKRLGEKEPDEKKHIPLRPTIATTSSYCELHIGTDIPCEVYQFKKMIGHLAPSEDFSLLLPPGKYNFEFVDSSCPEHQYSILYQVQDLATDYLEVKLGDIAVKNGASGAAKGDITSSIKTSVTSSKKPAEPIVSWEAKYAITDYSQYGAEYRKLAATHLPEKAYKVSRLTLGKGHSHVFLEGTGKDKAAVLTVLIDVLGFDPNEANKLLSLLPLNIISDTSLESAHEVCDALKKAGAQVSIQGDQGRNTITLNGVGLFKKGAIIDALCSLLGCTKNYAQDLIRLTPVNVVSEVSQETAERVFRILRDAGADVTWAPGEIAIPSVNADSSMDILLTLKSAGVEQLRVARILEQQSSLGKNAKAYIKLCPVNIGSFPYDVATKLYESLTMAGATVVVKEISARQK